MEALFVSGAIELANRVSSGLKTKGSVVNTAANLMMNKSLVDIANVARVEPIALVDADCVNLESIGDIMQTMQSLFSGYYLQAVSLVGNVGGVSVASRLAPLNPNRSVGFENLHTEARKSVSMEDFKHRLPLSTHSRSIAMEANTPVVSDKAIDSIKDAANLCIGKTYNVLIKEGKEEVTIPVSIRLMTSIVPTKMMVELFTYRDGFDTDMKERYHAWKSGRLEFVKDLILCNDLIDKRRKSAIKDPGGLLQQLSQRESRNVAASFLNGNASVASASNIAILSTDTLDSIELHLAGKLANSKVRSAIFENTNLMLMAVVNKGYERVTIYTRGLDTTTNVSFKDMKTASKGSGDNVLDIMKAYMSGSNPAI